MLLPPYTLIALRQADLEGRLTASDLESDMRHDGYGGFPKPSRTVELVRHEKMLTLLSEVRDWIIWSQTSEDVSWSKGDEDAFVARIEEVL